MPLGEPRTLIVEPSPLLPGSYLVRDVDNVHPVKDDPAGRREETWYLIVPTHRGPYCDRCASLSCAHTRAVEAYREAVRWPNGRPS